MNTLNLTITTATPTWMNQEIRGMKQESRTIRRFLQRVALDGRTVYQTLVHRMGHNKRQMTALMKHATAMVLELQNQGLPLRYVRTDRVTTDGYIANVFEFTKPLEQASLRELQHMVRAVSALLAQLEHFVVNENTVLKGVPLYKFRSLPYDVVPGDKLWCVRGEDVRGFSGVLEWCTDEADANAILAKMSRYPERFLDVHAEKYIPVHNGVTVAEAVAA